MQLTRFTDYALRVLIYAALNAERQITIGELTERYQIPRNHLLKVVHQLSKDGLLHSKRGRGGGLKLAKDPRTITVGYVVGRFEPHMQLIDCDSPKCVLAVGCVLNKAFHRALEAFLDVLNEYTIEDLLKNRDTMFKQLGIPVPVPVKAAST